MSGLTSTPILAGSMMICILILGGVLILLVGYGLFPSPDLLFVLLLLAFLAASMLVISLAEVVRNYCCRGSDTQNLHPDLRTRRDILADTRSRARWFQSSCCQTARPNKETPREKEQFENEANLNGAPSLSAYRALLQPHLFGLNSAWPFEQPQGEVVAEVPPEVAAGADVGAVEVPPEIAAGADAGVAEAPPEKADGADAGVQIDPVGRGPRVQMFIGDDYGDYCQVGFAEIVDGVDGVGANDDPDLPNESVVVAVDVEEKPPSRVLKDLGPVLGYKRGDRS